MTSLSAVVAVDWIRGGTQFQDGFGRVDEDDDAIDETEVLEDEDEDEVPVGRCIDTVLEDDVTRSFSS